MKRLREPVPGSLATYGKLAATAVVWGATWIAGRVAVSEAPPLAVASWRFLLAGLVLGALVVRREGWPRWSRPDWLLVTALGLTGIFLYNLCFLNGLRFIEAGRGALVVALTPALVAASDWLMFGAPMTPVKASGMVIATFGCLMVVTHGDPTLLFAGEVGLGEWLIIGCSVLWAVYTFIGRRGTRSLSPLAMTFGASLTGWMMLTATASWEGSLFALGGTTWRSWTSIGFLGLFGAALAFTWYAEAVQRIGATRAAVFINLVPVSAVLLGALLLDERLGLPVLAGGALVIAGVVITNQAGARLASGVHTKEKTA
ncbi:DMT family transporter [Accumulibacter sp.]|uniref:DMT family transporter n=1 Tax=Accumulibacter sp. TaxID=2053492 RepID=UPI0025D22E4F|nr:DMT family transporter [Accumulibacter sp.]MCM8595508.1 DMT family transporter [Accumulibacter sp.]MCM8626810.1 DMT family transporter [Accumulibacter sp.]MDS4049655.1 DMT family transporter [Accumulibacter sp.]